MRKPNRDQIYQDIETGELRVLRARSEFETCRGEWMAWGPNRLCIYIIADEFLSADYVYIGEL